MSTLAEKIDAAELPKPVQGEAVTDYARRVAYIGGLIGEQHALVHRAPVTIYVPPPAPPETDWKQPPADDFPLDY